jgi:hypothetical protein
MLESRNGSINADITLLNGTESLSLDGVKRKKRTTIDLKADNGDVDARLVSFIHRVLSLLRLMRVFLKAYCIPLRHPNTF